MIGNAALITVCLRFPVVKAKNIVSILYKLCEDIANT